MSDSVQPHRWQPTRLLCPWDSLGKNTGVGCHFLLYQFYAAAAAKSRQSCPTLCDPIEGSPPGSSVHGIFQARVLEWGAIAFSSQASLSITNSWSLLKLTCIKSVMPYNHLILCCPLLLPSIFPSIRVFSSESVLCIRWPKY